jgi:hypothetical protein
MRRMVRVAVVRRSMVRWVFGFAMVRRMIRLSVVRRMVWIFCLFNDRVEW